MGSKAAALVVAALLGGAALALAGTPGACSVYDPSLLEGDAGAAAEGGGPSDPCPHAVPPARPITPPLPQDEDDVRFVVALRRIGLGTEDAGAPPSLGLDLDGLCTCAHGGGSCRAPGADPCDDPAGRDNAAGALFQSLARRGGAAAGFFSEAILNQRIERGELGVLLEVRDYNGLADDPRVLVALFPSNGVTTWSPEADAGTPARWDGTDLWTRDPSGLLGGSTVPGSGDAVPKYADDDAYVAGGVLVARLDFPLALGGPGAGTLTLDLTGAVLMARLEAEGAGYRLEDGQIAGRWATHKLLTGLSSFQDPFDATQSLCGENVTYKSLKDVICRSMDVRADPGSDRTGEACDALSIGVGFRAEPSRAGPVRSRPGPDAGCGRNYADDCP